MDTYKWANSAKSYLYNSDLDEIPDSKYLQQAVLELETGTCDAIRGVWKDRSTMDGSLKRKNQIRSNCHLQDIYDLFALTLTAISLSSDIVSSLDHAIYSDGAR